MSRIRLYTSNRMEILVEDLVAVLEKPLVSPLEKEVIVVQSKGMEHWLCMNLARSQGICANVRFPFPNAFLSEIFHRVLPELPEQTPFDPSILAWRVMGILPLLLERSGFESLKGYLRDPFDELKLHQLSCRIADTFDQYLLFRPEMIFQWEKGRENHWQAELWRETVRGHEEAHRAFQGKALLERLASIEEVVEGIPERVSVFGISALPRFHIEVFAELSKHCEVNFFLMNPCRTYWGDILSDWEIGRVTARQISGEISPEALHLEKGNSLLASMGTLGREFFDLLSEIGCEEWPSFEDPGEGGLLSCIQSDILNLRERPLNGTRSLAPEDRSVQIDSCHSPMREMEVLQDRLLELFESHPDMDPGDVLIMTPDIEAYTPYIQTVFDLPTTDSRWIPFTIADRMFRDQSAIAEPFLALLDLSASRYDADKVLEILEAEAVRRRFELSDADLEVIGKWVRETRIRWGKDGEHRRRMGFPPFPENTWKAGLERLMMGYALAGGGEHLVLGCLPYDEIEGSEARVLGSLVEFENRVFDSAESLTKPRTLAAWAETLSAILDRFFLPVEGAELEMQAIRDIFSEMDKASAVAGAELQGEMDIRVIRWHIEQAMNKKGIGWGFMTGGLTFCAMLPMRSIPFKVICLVGLNGDAYPRQSRAPGFDLIAAHPKMGDRSRRNDDRYLFLEALLSAREKLYISYVGRSVKDNSPIRPSVLISELLDALEQGFELEGKTISDRLLTQHRLQPFSPEYFRGGERIFSYSPENCEAARRVLRPEEGSRAFITAGLSEAEEYLKSVDLDDFCRFFLNPCRFLLNRKLGIWFEERASIPGGREAFELEGLEKYSLEKDLLNRGLEGANLEDLLPVIRAKGDLPHGTVGKCIYERLSRGVDRFVKRTEPYLRGVRFEPLAVNFPLEGLRLTGLIKGLYPASLVRYRYAKVKPEDRLRAWLYHLVLNAVGPEGIPRESLLIGLEQSDKNEFRWAAWAFRSLSGAGKILSKIASRYQEGLAKPLPFFPLTSWSYAQEVLEKGKSHEQGIIKAREKWEGSAFSRGEREDAYYDLCFREEDALAPPFSEIAEDVFGPLMAHQEKIG